MNNDKIHLWSIVVFSILFIVALFRGALIDPKDGEEILKSMGFSEIQLINHTVFVVPLRGCGSDDAARLDYRAKNPAGVVVDVSVCSGWPFKGATVRYP